MVQALVDSLGYDTAAEPVCIRFANTLGYRGRSEPNERLASPEQLQKWLLGSNLLAGDLELDEQMLERARSLREAIYAIFAAVGIGSKPNPDDVEVCNGELAEALAKVELTDDLKWSLTEENPAERAMMLLVLSAAAFLTSGETKRIRTCADEDCRWLFLDHSKNQSRRWCSMSDCGNLAKARRFQAKKLEMKAG